MDDQWVCGANGLEILHPRVDQLEPGQLTEDAVEVDPQRVHLVQVQLAHVVVRRRVLRVNVDAVAHGGRGRSARAAMRPLLLLLLLLWFSYGSCRSFGVTRTAAPAGVMPVPPSAPHPLCVTRHIQWRGWEVMVAAAVGWGRRGVLK